ncbi:MAG: hypothetical protein P8X74_06390 [Reinekea sp.]
MESCKYHPDTPSNFFCDHCNESFCKDCVDHSVGGEARCFKCASLLNVRVTADNVEPFSRRLEKAFRYPLVSSAMAFVVGLSVATTIIAAMPLGRFTQLIILGLLTGLAINYSFLCLKATAEGELTPPDLSDAISGSISIIPRLLVMYFLLGWGVFTLGKVSPILAMLAMMILFIGMPAIMMAFALSNSVFAAINPITFIGIMISIGVPYLVLVMFLFIMVSSVSLLHSIIGDNLLVLSAILQSSVSYYYAMVAFHLMGYLLFQYQEKLGVASGNTDERLLEMASPAAVAMAHANIKLKEGDYKRTVELLQNAVTTEPQNAQLWQRYFEVLFRLGDKSALQKMADRYLNHLYELAQNDRLLSDFKRLRTLLPAYLPGYPHLRYQLATEYHVAGDPKTTVQLINGLHKQFPAFEQLVSAYSLMSQALAEMPGMAAQTAKCRQLIATLKKIHPNQESVAAQPPATTKASFVIDEPIKTKPKPTFATEVPEPENKPDEDDRDKPIEFG